MRWPTIWILLMATLMVSCTPFEKENHDADHRFSHNDPLVEDELMNGEPGDELPDSKPKRDLHSQRQNMQDDGVNFDVGDLNQHDDRYIGFCDEAHILMWPGNSRKFWSYGYVYLVEPYLANCNMKYYYNTRNYPGDPFCRFGFTVKGSFESHNAPYTHCTDTDYVLLNDTDGNAQYYCGANSDIEWTTSHSDFEFHFVTKPNSPRGRGFFVIIQSFKMCGGAFTMENDGPTGNLLTPLFPKNYPGNVACTWYFAIPTVEKEVSVKIGCSSFSLQAPFNNGTNFCLDSTTFLSEVPGVTSTYCSNTLANNNHMVYSIHADLLVTFRSDSTVHDTGFNCTYEYILYAE